MLRGTTFRVVNYQGVIDQEKNRRKVFTDPVSLGFLVRLATAAGSHETYAPTGKKELSTLER